MSEFEVKDAGEKEILTTQQEESQVLEQAVDKGEIAPEAAGVVPEDGIYRVNLDGPSEDVAKPEADAVQQVQGETEDSVLRVERVEEPSEEVKEPDQPEGPIERIQDDEVETPVKDVAPPEVEAPKVELPENIEKLIDFMKETGGTLEDYTNLNKNFDDMNDVDVIKEWYKKNKPHLDADEIDFLMDDAFLFDQENDEPREIKKKQLAFKEALYDAKKQLQGSKDQYYSDLKFNTVAPEHKDAIEYYANSKKQEESNNNLVTKFKQETDKVFHDEFKGFEFKVGEDKFRFKVQDRNQVKEYQSDINNFVKEFLGEDGSISDAKGYHKALYAAKNADKIAQHFYEQGRADAIRSNDKESKNIDMGARSDASANVAKTEGTQFRVVDNDSSKLRFKPYTRR